VLVVDDKPAIREMLMSALEQDGLRVIAAAEGDSALERFRSESPDLILLDLMMPHMSGLEVCRAIRRESAVPIVILSARDSEIDKVVGLELGADDYITKPFSLRELMARVRTQLRRLDDASMAAPSVSLAGPYLVHLGDVVVDVPGHRVLRDSKEVMLKPKVFELLSLFVRHPGQVFSRDLILERIWGYDFQGESRTVDVHVHWLRTAIEQDTSHPRYLQTVRGTGYVLRLLEDGAVGDRTT
jgi:two-component system response regulator VicR